MPNWKKVIVSGSSPELHNITANQFAKSGGTSAQFLKADGSVDSSTYLTSAFPFTGDAQITGSLLISGSKIHLRGESASPGPILELESIGGGSGKDIYVKVGDSNENYAYVLGADDTGNSFRISRGNYSSATLGTGDKFIIDGDNVEFPAGDVSVTGNITGSNIYATSDIFLGAANSFGIRLNNPNQTEFTIGPYTSTTPYFTVSDSFITIPSSGILLSENTNLALDNSGGANSSAAVRFLGGASIAGNISTTSITASSAISASGNITANQFFGDGSTLSNLPFIYEKGTSANSIQPISGSNSATSPSASIGGGINNIAQGPTSRIGGGQGNTISSCLSYIGGGYQNQIATGIYGSIVGGSGNILTRLGGSVGGKYSFIGGGQDNASCARYGVIGGGCDNHLDNDTYASSVVGGENNHIEKSCYSFIGGGELNCIKQTTGFNSYNMIVGGYNSNMLDSCNTDNPPLYSTILGGRAHMINSSQYSSILGGCGNKIFELSHQSVIAGGFGNRITNENVLSFIGGGINNCISGSTSSNSVIGGGCENVVGQNSLGSTHSVIGGGYRNCLQGQDYSGILGGKNNTSVGCNNDNIFIIGSDICVNKNGTTPNGTGCMTYVNDLCAWGTVGTDGEIIAATGSFSKIIQTGEVAIEFKKMKSGDSDPIEVESDLQITQGNAIKATSPITFADTANITASMNAGAFTHPAIIASGSEAMQATGSVGIQGVLSLPDIANVSASIAAAGSGNVSTSGTPANNQLSVFTNSNTIEGDSDLTYNSSTKLLSAPTASFDHLIVSELISSSVIVTSGSNIFGDEATDTQTLNGSVILNNIQNQASEATALMINGSNVVGTRELGSNAFTSTTIGTTTNNLTVDNTTIQLNSGTTFNGSAARTISVKTAAIVETGTGLATGDQIYTFVTDFGYTTNTGTVTSVGTNTGLSGTVTTSGNLSLALADLADMTQAWDNSADEFIVLDGGTQKRKLSSEIFGSNAFTSTSIPTAVTDLSDVSSAGSGQIITTTERNAISSNTSQISTNTSQISTNTSTLGEKAGNGENSDITELTGLTTALSVGQGGTGLTTLSSGEVPYGNGTSALNTNGAFVFDQSVKQLQLTGDSSNAPLKLTNVQANAEETKVGLILNSTNDGVEKATLGSNAFNSTNFLTSLSGAVLTSGNQSAAGTKTFTGQIVIGANGSISAPMIRFPGSSTNTGFYSSNPDEISITIGGTQKVIFNSGTSEFKSHLRAHCLGVGGAAPGTSGEIWAYGDVVANYSSDKRLKKNIKPISGALDKLLQISGVEFDWIEKKEVHSHKGHDVGVIAQEIEEVLPEVVATRDNGYKAVNYEKIVPLLIEAIKDLKAEVDELKKSK